MSYKMRATRFILPELIVPVVDTTLVFVPMKLADKGQRDDDGSECDGRPKGRNGTDGVGFKRGALLVVGLDS